MYLPVCVCVCGQPAFEKATLATRPGEISAVMESDSGVHIIFRYA